MPDIVRGPKDQFVDQIKKILARLRALETQQSSGGNFVPLFNEAPTVTTDFVSSVVGGTGTFPSYGSPEDILFAVGSETFPSLVVTAGGSLYLGDGTFDPTDATAPNFTQMEWAGASGGFLWTTNSGGYVTLDNVGGFQVHSPLELGSIYSGTHGSVVSSAALDPNGSFPGQFGDYFFRKGNVAGHHLYVCSATGDASSAVWTPLV